jgi:hypothetical protein
MDCDWIMNGVKKGGGAAIVGSRSTLTNQIRRPSANIALLNPAQRQAMNNSMRPEYRPTSANVRIANPLLTVTKSFGTPNYRIIGVSYNGKSALIKVAHTIEPGKVYAQGLINLSAQIKRGYTPVWEIYTSGGRIGGDIDIGGKKPKGSF